MTYKDMALKLPEDVRKRIVNEKLIDTASPAGGEAMDYLFFSWYTMIDPTAPYDYACGMCREKTLKDWNAIKPEIVKLVKGNGIDSLLKRLI